MDKLKLTEEQKKDMVRAVRAIIERELFGQSRTDMPSLDEEVFVKHYGLFVTLTMRGSLRGCIGYVEGIKPLREAVKDMAVQAAFHDPRFYPLTKDEYENIDIEISILYPLEPVEDFDTIQVGKHGLVVERGYHKGLLLPQVATEYGWDRERFMNETCRKAGLESFAWDNGAKFYKFEAEVFNEEDLGLK